MMSSSIPWSDPFVQTTRFDPDRPENLTRSEPPKIILKKQKQNNKKKWEKNALTKWTFDFDQKVKIFKKGLSHSIFRVHSNFGIRFFVQDSEIVQTVQISESWLLHKFWPGVKIFKKNLSCPIFRKDSDFGVYFFIWESEIA